MRLKTVLGRLRAAHALAPAIFLLLVAAFNTGGALAADPGKSALSKQAQEAQGKQGEQGEQGNQSEPAKPSGPEAPECGVNYGYWANESSLPAPRNQAMGAVINDKFYVLGGYNSNYSEASSVYRLDTSAASPTWQSFTPMPVRVYGSQAVVFNRQIFIPGGYGESGPVSNMQIYSPGNNQWLAGPPLPAPMGGVAAAQYNGKIYIFGGARENNQPTNTVYEYDPVNGGYAPKSRMPGPAYNASAVVHNGRIYVIGGSGYYYAHYVYNPALDQWLGIAPSPRTLLDRVGLLSFGGEIWAFSGSYAQQVPLEQTVQIYNPQHNTWRYGGRPFLNQRINTTAVGLVGNRAFVAGGQLPDSSATGQVQSIAFTGTPCYPECQVSYPDVPPNSPYYSAVRCLACKYILGGYGNGAYGPGDLITRGQLSKVVANAAGYNENPGGQRFQDVAPNSTFFAYINRLASRGIIGGYACGAPGEPCAAGNLPYFRPNGNATRAQIVKIIAMSSPLSSIPSDAVTDAPQGDGPQSPSAPPEPAPPFFADVPPGSPFYATVQKLGRFNVIEGYACGGPGEPCIESSTRYFRPNNPANRGQVAKMVASAFYPACDAP